MTDNKLYAILIVSICFLGSVCVIAISLKQTVVKEKAVKIPCKCPSLYTQRLWFEKAAMYMDSMEHSDKANRVRLTDSTRKYNELLRRNEL